MIRLIVGLGNPGTQYSRNRHNIGFLVLEEFARRQAATWLKRGNSELAETRGGTNKIWLQKPFTYMNLSGEAVLPFMRFHKLEPSELLVIHDDLDLPFGRLRIRTGGSSGGQNGIKDISAKLGQENYVRLKIGISRPPPEWSVPNWVLSNFKPEEQTMLEEIIVVAANAVTAILKDGAQVAQNVFNSTDLRPKPMVLPTPDSPDTTIS